MIEILSIFCFALFAATIFILCIVLYKRLKSKVKTKVKFKLSNNKQNIYQLKARIFSMPRKKRRVFISLIVFIVFSVLFSNIILALIITVIYIYIDLNIEMRKKAKLASIIDLQTIESLTIIKSAILSGQSLQNALNTAAIELKEPIKNEFAKISNKLSLGIDFNKVLSDISQKAPSKEFKFMIDAIKLSKDSGASLSNTFEKIANCASQRITLQNKIMALTAQGKISGLIVSFIPFLIILIMYVMQPDMISVLFTTIAGNFLLLIVTLMILTGSFVMKKLTEIDL
jgi:tight adherence protein B